MGERLKRSSYSVNAGNTATIDCPVVPGSCVDQYSVQWKNASNTSHVFYQKSSSRTFISSDRYRLSTSSFALTIGNVQPSDSVSGYVCDVTVIINNQVYRYSASLQINQTLLVSGKQSSQI